MRFSAHLGYLFQDRPPEERFAAARRAGFSAVEHPSPYALPPARAARLLAEEGLAFAQLALPAGDAARGEKGLACLPGRESEFREALATAADYAEAIGCRLVHPMAGIAPAGWSQAELWAIYVDRLAEAAEFCAPRGLQVLIEPIGTATVPGYFIGDFGRALKARAAVGSTRASLLLDTFHAAAGGLDPARFLGAHADAIGHIHVADHPGRHEPGTGEVDFPAFFGAVARFGFSGFIGCEYVPAGATEEGLDWMAGHAEAAA